MSKDRIDTTGFTETRIPDGALSVSKDKAKKEPKVLKPEEKEKLMSLVSEKMDHVEENSVIKFYVDDEGLRHMVIDVNVDQFKDISKSGTNISHEAIPFCQTGDILLPKTATMPEKKRDFRISVYVQSRTDQTISVDRKTGGNQRLNIQLD